MSGTHRARRRAAALSVALVATACATNRGMLTAPEPSSSPAEASRGLRAGFAREDITPPIGVALAGFGFEGQRAMGWRHRLYARAMVLHSGLERLAIVSLDLGFGTPILVEAVARRIAPATGIGGDRLFMTNTHTHAGPGNFFLAEIYNQQATPLHGYDSTLVEFLADRIARAVTSAANDMHSARAAWGWTRVRGATRNRSLEAHLRNPGRWAWLASQEGDRSRWRDIAVDDTLMMLRVDRCDETPDCEPFGAFSTFAIHSTLNSAANELIDGDVHAVIERGLERHMDSLRGRPTRFLGETFHLVANGSEGDVSPTWADPVPGEPRPREIETRCELLLELRPGLRRGGPRTPPPMEEWRFDRREVEDCVDRARPELDRIGNLIVGEARALYDRLGEDLRSEVPLGRSVRTLRLGGLGPPEGAAFGGISPTPPRTPHRVALCPRPMAGDAFAGGGEDGRTRIHDWKVFGFVELHLGEGAPATNPGSGCHAPKRGVGGPLQRRSELPQSAHIGVLRIGDVALAALPAEPTTETGRRVKRALLEAGIPGVRDAGVLGITNGFIQYLATAEEYAEQAYEGGSTLYGPHSEAVLRAHYAELAAMLRDGLPSDELDSIPGGRGPSLRSFPRARGAAPGSFERTFTERSCVGGRLSARWEDVHPGRQEIHGAPVIEIWRAPGGAGAHERVAWDDQWDVEVRAVGPDGARFTWEVRWYSAEPGTSYRVLLTPRQGFAETEIVVSC